jgi:hypothetical protein
MQGRLAAIVLGLGVCLAHGAIASAQGGASSSLTGTVLDTGGGVVPGATVVVKNDATAIATNTLTNTAGVFSVPALDAGTYTVSVSLVGFKTAVVKNVVLAAATPSNIKVTLDVGSLNETIEVKTGAEIVQTQSATISTTINADQINKIPLPTRNALNFVTFLPGVDTAGVNRDSLINGLPQSTISITMDGVNIQDLYNKTGDGFFARVTPRQDAVEQVTVTSATPGADAAGAGAVQIRFVTRSGTNQYKGTAYHYFRHPSLNTNYFFNTRNGLDKNHVVLNQFGASEGGPLMIPGLFDGRGKAFFFVNHEEFHQPTEVARTATMLNPLSQTGVFQYTTSTGTQQINLLQLAAAQNNPAITSTLDPTIQSVLNQIAATAPQGNLTQNTDPNTMRFVFQNEGHQIERQPTVRIDYNLSATHRLSGSYNWEKVQRDPDILNDDDPAFPGLPNFSLYNSYRPSASLTLRSTLSGTMVNEARVGGAWGPSYFGLQNIVPEQFSYLGGFALDFPLVTDPYINRNPSARTAKSLNVDDTLNWLKGKHNFTFGGAYQQVNALVDSRLSAALLGFGVDQTNDPANAMFTTANFPGASTNNLTNARSLYALLTGRVTSIGGDIRLDDDTNQYTYLGLRRQRGRLHEFGIFAQDSWRMTPTLTINAGLRYELQLPFSTQNDVYSMSTFADLCGISGTGTGLLGRGCNLFNPNVQTGIHPTFQQYNANSPGYNTDYNNLAPNIGIAWRPNVQGGWLRTLLGDPEQATLRGGYSVAYNQNGIGDLTGIYAANPGSAVTVTRNNGNGNLVLPGESWPVLFRDRDRLGALPTCAPGQTSLCLPATVTYPIAVDTTNLQNLNILDPNIELSLSRSYSIGFQRSINRDTAVEVRYVGTRNVNGWTTENWNETNVFENGFLDEFRLAQANLVANQAQGRGNTFAYFGPGTGTAPLPTYLAYLSGVPAAQATDPTRYTSTQFTSTTRLGNLSRIEPNVISEANFLFSTRAQRVNALNAGLSPNFFRLNPEVNQANITRSASGSAYDSLQLEVRRRLARGLQLSGNYTYGVRTGTALDTLRRDRVLVVSTGGGGGVRHAFKLNWTYEVPVGRGKRFGTNLNSWLNGVVGNWEFSGAGRVQSGRILTATGVRLVGMDEQELQDAFKVEIRPAPGTGVSTVFNLPDDIILNTRRAFNSDPTSATGYSALGVPEGRYISPASGPDCIQVVVGDCGPRNVFVTGPMFTKFDMSFRKTFPLRGRANVQLQLDVLNAFNAINFTPVFNPGEGATIFQVTSAYLDLDNTFDPGGRLGQIVWRINW